MQQPRHPGTPAPRHPGTPAPRHPGTPAPRPAPRHPGTPAPRHPAPRHPGTPAPGTPAPLNHRRPSTFSAACPGCGRTLLGFLATLSVGLPTVFAVTVVLLSAVLPVAEAQTVVRGPYLQSGTSSSVIIKWRTDEATDSLVRYGLDHDPEGLQLSATNSTSTTEHAVQLTGLSADVKYFYSVGTSSALQLAGGDSDHFVVTAPVPGTAKPTRIWVIGDSGTANRNARAVRDAFLNFTESRNPDLWIMLGDNAYYHGTDNEYQRAVFNTYSQVLPRTVLWPTLGNHGKGTSDSTTESGPYYDIFSLPRNGEAGGVASGTEAYYSFDYGNIHFVCLNSETDPSPDGAMMTWLEADLAANDKEWIIAFWHRPPYSRGSANSDTDSRQIALRQNAVPLLERYGVDLVLTGHTHAYERSYLIDGHYGLSGYLHRRPEEKLRRRQRNRRRGLSEARNGWRAARRRRVRRSRERGRHQNRRVAGPPGHGRFDQDSGVNGARREREPS